MWKASRTLGASSSHDDKKRGRDPFEKLRAGVRATGVSVFLDVVVEGKRWGRGFVCKLQILASHDPLNPRVPRHFRTFFVQKLLREFVYDSTCLVERVSYERY